MILADIDMALKTNKMKGNGTEEKNLNA